MRVGVISPEFPPDIGGIDACAVEFVRKAGAPNALVNGVRQQKRWAERA